MHRSTGEGTDTAKVVNHEEPIAAFSYLNHEYQKYGKTIVFYK